MNESPLRVSRALRGTVLTLVLVAAVPCAIAQQPPNAGGQLLQISPAPLQPRSPAVIRIEERGAAPAATGDQQKIRVNVLQVTGATAFTEADLIALTQFSPGAQLSLGDLQAMAARITAHYRAHGYFVAQAWLPAQDVKDNAITIAVAEGRYGSVTVRNQTNLSESIPRRALEGLASGDPITTAPLESRLLLLSDLPGVNVKSTLVPGTTPGTSDLIVDLTPGARVSGSIDADNGGSRYTGQYRIGATVNLNDPLGLGDVAGVRLLTAGSGLNYARAFYQVPVGKAQVGVAYSWLDYRLGREFANLQTHGTARVASLYGRYPVLRSRDDNVYLQLELDWKKFHDAVDSTASVTDRNSRVLLASVAGDHRDDWGGGGSDSYSLTLASGVLDIETPAALAADALTARTNGRFNKLSFSANRLQRLGGPWSLYAAVGGQVASKNLDSSEKMVLGGMNAVRSYPEGESYADEGLLLTLEARLDLPKPATLPGNMQLVGFVDGGSVTLNHTPWAPGPNHRTLSGAGVGINWGEPGNFLARAYYAHRLGGGPALSAPDRSGRFWVQLVKYF